MVMQRKMSSAHDVYFNMLGNHYLSENPDKTIFGELTTPISINTISEFLFLNKNLRPIGRHTDFIRTKNDDIEFKADYRIENKKIDDCL